MRMRPNLSLDVELGSSWPPRYSLVAMLNWVTFLPLVTTRISGSRVRRPVNRTRFMRSSFAPRDARAFDDDGRRDGPAGRWAGAAGLVDAMRRCARQAWRGHRGPRRPSRGLWQPWRRQPEGCARHLLQREGQALLGCPSDRSDGSLRWTCRPLERHDGGRRDRGGLSCEAGAPNTCAVGNNKKTRADT
jgi:hypothetical protein